MAREQSYPALNPQKCFSVVVRPEPPTATASENGTVQLRKLADQCAQIEGFEEIDRDERGYQVEVILCQHN